MDDIIQKFIFIMDSTIVLYLTCTNVQPDNFPRKTKKSNFYIYFLSYAFSKSVFRTSYFCFLFCWNYIIADMESNIQIAKSAFFSDWLYFYCVF